MAEVRECSVQEARERLARGECRMVDVREYPEYVDGHVEGSFLLPLRELVRDPGLAGSGMIMLLCRSGRRAAQAAEALAQRPDVEAWVIAGGAEAWERAGMPLHREKGPISLERQVRIAAGALVLTGLLVPGMLWLSYFVGAGLIFAGVTNTCGMGLLIARLPWNRRPTPPACPVGA